jgi:hypothetical protein
MRLVAHRTEVDGLFDSVPAWRWDGRLPARCAYWRQRVWDAPEDTEIAFHLPFYRTGRGFYDGAVLSVSGPG